MKIKTVFACTWLLAAASLQAAVLTATTAVHTKPDVESPVVSYLKAGSTATPTTDSMATSPAGWMAIELSGPFEAYVQNKEIGKSLDVRPGAAIHLLPKLESGVLATMEAGDKVDITGLRGKWTQIKLMKKLTGYIHVTSSAGSSPAPAHVSTPASTSPAATAAAVPAASSAPAPMQSSPVQPSAYGVTSGGQAAPMVNLGDGGSATLPRAFQGKFVSTKRPFVPRRPYDYQINDDAGVRFAYLDMSKLLLTETVDNYIDHTVAVFGVARNIPGTKGIVIEVESLQLK